MAEDVLGVGLSEFSVCCSLQMLGWKWVEGVLETRMRSIRVLPKEFIAPIPAKHDEQFKAMEWKSSVYTPDKPQWPFPFACPFSSSGASRH